MTFSPQQLGQARMRVETKAPTFARQLALWFNRFAVAELKSSKLTKGFSKISARDKKRLTDQLRAILVRFGANQVASSANDSAGRQVIGSEAIRRNILGRRNELGVIREWLKGIDTTSELILEESRQAVLDAIRDTVAESRDDNPTQSVLARRIRAAVASHASFSQPRAFRIARTELAIAQDTGAMAGFEASGVERIRWLAYSSPIWPRRHDKMDGKTIKVGERFTLPSGVKLRYPHDPTAPVGEIVNCRCTVAAVK